MKKEANLDVGSQINLELVCQENEYGKSLLEYFSGARSRVLG